MTNHESGGLLRRLSRAFAALCRGITGSSSGTAPAVREPEFEPVHGWTRRQLDDYLWRNPDYRPAYEAMLRKGGGPSCFCARERNAGKLVATLHLPEPRTQRAAARR
jgi:hypothetical protein